MLPNPQQANKPAPAVKTAVPQALTDQEINDAILAGFAQADSDFDAVMGDMAAPDRQNQARAIWQKMSPVQKQMLQKVAPDQHKKAQQLFGQ
jgi:hypothetical protein